MFTHVATARVATVLVVGTLFLGGCGGEESAGPTEVLTKKESTTLREAGTAEGAAEVEAREEKQAAVVERMKVDRVVLKAFRLLKKAEDDFDRAELISEIGELGPRAVSHVDRITPFLDAKGNELRRVAVSTVSSLMGADAEPHLRKALKDDDDEVKAEAVAAWGRVGIEDLSVILPLLTDFSDYVQMAAVKTVVASKKAASLVPTLCKSLPEMDAAAVKPAIAYLMAEAKESLTDELLLEMLDHQNARVRAITIQSVGALMRQTDAIKRKLVLILGDDPEQGPLVEAHRLLKAWAGDAAPDYDPFAEEEARAAAAKGWKAWLEGS